MPSRLRLPRHALNGAADSTPAHLQMETLFQNRRRVSVGQTLCFVHEHSPGQGFRPHLHRRCPDGIGGLQRMAPLHPLAALDTSANRNIKPPDPGAAHDFFLILCFDPLYRQRAAALGTLLGNGNGDRFVDMIRDRSTVVLAVGFPALASRRSRVALTLTPRKWGPLDAGRHVAPLPVPFASAQPLRAVVRSHLPRAVFLAVPDRVVLGSGAVLAPTPESGELGSVI